MKSPNIKVHLGGLFPLPKDTLLVKVYEPLPEKRKLGVESNVNIRKFKEIGSKTRFHWIFQNGHLASFPLSKETRGSVFPVGGLVSVHMDSCIAK